MALPKQVQEAQERAERLIEQRNAAAEPEKQPEAEAQQETPPEPRQPEPPKQDKTDWKARYHVLQGKYNAEVPRYAAELKELNRKLAEAEQAIAELKTQAKEQPEPSPDFDRLRDEYGPDVVSAIERVAAQKAGELIKPLQGEVEQTKAEREAQRKREEADASSRNFAEAVNDLVPDWEAIDKLPEFHAYLADVGSDGRTRQEVLMEAASHYDAAGAARIFAAFKRTDAYKSHATPVAPPRAKDALAAQVVPEPSGRDRNPADSGGKVYTRAEISAFFRDLAMGKIDSERAKQIERDIDAAMREGRIR